MSQFQKRQFRLSWIDGIIRIPLTWSGSSQAKPCRALVKAGLEGGCLPGSHWGQTGLALEEIEHFVPVIPGCDDSTLQFTSSGKDGKPFPGLYIGSGSTVSTKRCTSSRLLAHKNFPALFSELYLYSGSQIGWSSKGKKKKPLKSVGFIQYKPLPCKAWWPEFDPRYYKDVL